MAQITRRSFLKTSATTITSLALSNKSQASSNKSPNVVFILVDDLGWIDLGCYGSSFYETPNIDRLAASGMRFTDGYASCPVCSPTRASIMTGKYPARLNITDWIPGSNDQNKRLLGTVDKHELPLSEETLAETFRDNGYKTFYAGKWHLGDEGFFPEDQGFDINKGGHHRGSPPGGYCSPFQNPKLEDGPDGEYLPDRLTDESIKFMKNNRDEKFLLYLSFYTVHTPIQASKRHVDYYKKKADVLSPINGPKQIKEHDGITKQRQDNAAYASMVHAMDENVGRLLDTLDDLQLTDDTIVVFTSDNGGLSTLRNRGYPTSNLPLRAGKGWCYEGGIRVPFIIRAPGITKPGSVSHEPVISNDFYPTLLHLADLDAKPKQHRDGLSLVPLMKNVPSLNREALYWHYPHYHGSAWTPGACIRTRDWKLIEFYDKDKIELYNLKNDIGEKKNVAALMPDKAKQLQAMLHRWQKEMGALYPTPNPDFKPKVSD